MGDNSDGTPGKKPRAPSVTERPASHLNAQIARQIFIALQRRGADKLLSIIENYCDTLSDAEILSMLREYNRTGEVQPPPQRC